MLKQFFNKWKELDKESRENLDIINGSIIALILFKLMSIMLFPIYIIFHTLKISNDNILKIIGISVLIGFIYLLYLMKVIPEPIIQFIVMFFIFNPYFWLFLIGVIIYDLFLKRKE